MQFTMRGKKGNCVIFRGEVGGDDAPDFQHPQIRSDILTEIDVDNPVDPRAAGTSERRT